MSHAEVDVAGFQEGCLRDEVEVLLATYNGGRFLREQIESILSQDSCLRVLARDDGSRDSTVAILEEYASTTSTRFRILVDGESTGDAKKNFLRLMEGATAEYVCFSDQDDVWLPGKIRLTMAAMSRLEARHGKETPCLVFTDLAVVDETLHTLQKSMWEHAGLDPESIHRIERLLGQNVVTGCTTLINRRMLELARAMPEEATMHDRWIALLCAALGKGEVIRESTILYRQHGSNVIGAGSDDNSVSGLMRRSRDGKSRRMERLRSEEQAAALLRVHGREMTETIRRTLRAYLISGRSDSRVERVWTMLRYGFFRHGLLRNLATATDLWQARTNDEF